MAEICVKTMQETALPQGIPPDLENNLQTDTVIIPVKLCNLPPMSAVANSVLALLSEPDVELKKLAAVMEGDPAFAADVLFLANSSLFGFPSRLQVIRHAVAVLGLERIKALAITVAMRAFLAGGGPLIRQCWQHSTACAVIAEEISPAFCITPHSAYSAGLLHDIGRHGLLKSYTSEYAPVLQNSFESMAQVLQAERSILNVEHSMAGAWLVKNWALPRVFADICEHHHEPITSKDSELLQVIKTACRMADAFGFSAVHYGKCDSYDDIIWGLPRNIRRDVFLSGADLKAKVEERLKGFE